MKEFLETIGITQSGNISDDGCYIIDFKNDLDWSKAYSKLDKSNYVEEEEDSTNVTLESSTVQFVNDKFTITMVADFESDIYKLICREN